MAEELWMKSMPDVHGVHWWSFVVEGGLSQGNPEQASRIVAFIIFVRLAVLRSVLCRVL
jgi:hypothetical protein